MSRHRVLIVDDDADTLKVMSTALSSRFEVVQARDGLEALQNLEDFQPDFAIVDVMMPLMDGYELCEAVRRHDGFKAIPVLFLSGYGSKENIRRGYAAGANLFMTKPIDPLRVLKNVEFTINHEKPGIRKKRYTIEELNKRNQNGPGPQQPRSSSSAADTNGQVRAASKPPPKSPQPPPRPAHERRPPPRPQPAPPPPRDFGPISDSEELDIEENVQAPPPRPPAPQPPPPPSSSPSGQGEPEIKPPLYTRPERGPLPRIMVVDNEDEVRDLIDLTLRQDYEVTTARDGVEAIENIVIYQPDLLIVDIMMPKMNGYQLIQTMRRNVAYKDLPIIVVSGKATDRDRAYVERLGATAFLGKPFEVDDLKKLVDDLTADPGFTIGEKRLPINEIIEREFLKAKEHTQVADQADRKRKFSELQEILNEDARRNRNQD